MLFFFRSFVFFSKKKEFTEIPIQSPRNSLNNGADSLGTNFEGFSFVKSSVDESMRGMVKDELKNAIDDEFSIKIFEEGLKISTPVADEKEVKRIIMQEYYKF